MVRDKLQKIREKSGNFFLMSDYEQCSNRLELYLISLLVNFSCELGPIMTRYDFIWAKCVILSNVRTDLNFTPDFTLVNFACELGQIMTRYDFLHGLDE